jgi:hypothetical protein
MHKIKCELCKFMMVYHNHFIRSLKLPSLPHDIQEKINWNFLEYRRKGPVYNNPNYIWSDDFNKEVNEWCQKNVAGGVYYAFQLATKDMPTHKDKGSTTKLLYLLDTGGDNVYTEFYEEDGLTLIHDIVLVTHQWYLIKTDVNHAVKGITTPRVRFSICATLFSPNKKTTDREL